MLIFRYAYQTKWARGLDKMGWEQLVIIKVTYQLTTSDSLLVLAEEQVPIIEADISTGEHRFSAALYESDYANFKLCCDVLVNSFAYTSFAKSGKEVPVQLKLVNQGKELLNKQFIVKDNCYRELSVILFTSFY